MRPNDRRFRALNPRVIDRDGRRAHARDQVNVESVAMRLARAASFLIADALFRS